MIALLLVGGAVAFMGSGDDPGPGHSEARPAPVKPAQADAQPAKKARSEKELAAAVAAKMAAKADDVDKALDYAREAVRLAPANAKYKQLLERIEAKKATALPPPTPSAAAPPPPPAPAPAPAPAAAAKPARKTHRATSKPAPKPGGRVSPAILEE